MVLITPSSPALDLGGTLVADQRPGDIWSPRGGCGLARWVREHSAAGVSLNR